MPAVVAAACRSLLVGGIVSFLVPALNGPLKVGVPLQPLACFQPVGGPDTSTRSAESRPKVGVPQTRMSSLVWNGPLILSPLMNWISVHVDGRPARYLSPQLVCAVERALEVE